ncbi:hypothetical protein QYE76_014347 [Lolium multiflorum]|uniref:GATA-type domain-containing protein n=1 Tax=Lolium multiflorum TaxID=4521 RepID=A0AAD8U4R4_LOLMU|nr:hypothetical protein QYE76_014347 [Lolium multiflorum]
MKPCSAMYQIHGRQARSPAESNDADAGGGGVGALPVAVSALAVPDDPLDGIMQCLGAEKGFAVGSDDCWATGAWFDDYRGGSMDMSTQAGVDYFEMLLDFPDATATPVLSAEGATEKTPTRAGAATVEDWPAMTTNLSPSLASSDEDNASWMSSSESSSEDDDADAHWLPGESKKSGGTKRRLQQHQKSASGGQSKPETQTVVRPPPLSVVAVVESGGGGDNNYWCHHCSATKSPLWRAGPDGPKTLCNACGLRKNKRGAPTTTKRLRVAKPIIGSAKSNSYSVMPLAEDATVVRKKRSVAIRIG